MKTNFTQLLIIRILLFILICLYSILVFGQTNNSKSADYKNKIISNSRINANYTLNNRHVSIEKNADDVLTNILSGDINDDQVKLRWSFPTDNNISTVVLEKGQAPDMFQDRAIFWLNFDGPHKSDFKYTDAKGKKRSAYYRLKIVAANGEVYYINILHFIGKKQKETILK
jgi:hypothetical protein